MNSGNFRSFWLGPFAFMVFNFIAKPIAKKVPDKGKEKS